VLQLCKAPWHDKAGSAQDSLLPGARASSRLIAKTRGKPGARASSRLIANIRVKPGARESSRLGLGRRG